MKENIVVVGGYGRVGGAICRDLGDLYPGKVYAAGRSLGSAEQFCQTTGGKVSPLQLDIKEKVDSKFWDNTKLIVMCLDQLDVAFVRSCIENGTHYVDISADYSFLAKVETLHALAAENKVTAMLSVGLAPGLTNLMALHANNQLDRTDAIDISLLSGLGDYHGKGAIEWTVDNWYKDFNLLKDGRNIVVSSFSDGKTTDFGSGLGKWKAYRFNFSDQHSLMRTLDAPWVATRLCFDSYAMTKGLYLLKAAKITKLLKIRWIRDAVVRMFGKIRFGKELISIKIDAWGKKCNEDTKVECFLLGKNEADITARVAFFVADRVYRSECRHGVYHIDQQFELISVLDRLSLSVSFENRVNGEIYA
ncbi:saccharopine dehydrogenase family protein [Paenibacillus sp. SI8]|uniref:saccharopine dehydrogenase family protein n=1 Tax=unclassified Paenibacillus TaxID=185978 RepID=UPI003467B8AE